MPDLGPNSPWSKSPWIGRVFIGSLVLNVFLLGFTVARSLSPSPSTPPRQVSLDLSSLPNGLPRAFLEEMEENFEAREDKVAEIYETIEETRQEIEELMAEEEFDEHALSMAYEKLRHQQMEIQGPMHEALIESARNLQLEQRREYAKARRGVRKEERRRARDTGSVDGSTWSFGVKNGKIEIDMDAIRAISRLSILKQLEQLDNIEVFIDDDFGSDFDPDDYIFSDKDRQDRAKRRADRREAREERRKAREEQRKKEDENDY